MKLKFFKDTFYGSDLFAHAGEIKEVSKENGFAARWIKRGALPVSDLTVEEKKVQPKVEIKPEVVVEKIKETEKKIEETSLDFLDEVKPEEVEKKLEETSRPKNNRGRPSSKSK